MSSKKVPTLIINSLNNMDQQNKIVYCDSNCIDFYKEVFTEKLGYTLVLIDNVSIAKMNEALDWYAENTDWSCFKRKHLIEAKNFLLTN